MARHCAPEKVPQIRPENSPRPAPRSPRAAFASGRHSRTFPERTARLCDLQLGIPTRASRTKNLQAQSFPSASCPQEVTNRKLRSSLGGGEETWRRPAAGEVRGHADSRERLDSSIMAASPHALSSRLLTGTASAIGKVLFFLHRATPWFRPAATLGALGEVGLAPVRGCDLWSGLK